MVVSDSPRRIRLLEPLLANQIAAGEVVERPASVVKELLENSLDAGASSITLEVEQGGVALIRVRDDGSGICRDDLPLALARHATSKVYDQAELLRVHSLGFRGEALASIASVSRLELVSRSTADAHGWRIGTATELAPQAHPVGTTVEVRELFYNTPARRKFLRSERTEIEHIAEVVRRIALSRHDVSLILQHNQRQVLQVRPASERAEQERRIAAVCGRSFLEGATYIEFETGGLRLWGWLVRPEYGRPQADLQYFYINGRIIRDRVVTHALRQAYGDALQAGRHPAYVLYLEMDPAQVDVNVHPTKHEVRFREARHVHDFLFRALRDAFSNTAKSTAEQALVEHGRVQELAASYVTVDAGQVEAEVGQDRRILGLVQGQYLLAEAGSLLRLIDLRAARARQVAASLQAVAQQYETVRAQLLLLPQHFEVTAAERELLARYHVMLQRFGFEIDELGPLRMVLRQVPAILRQIVPQHLLNALLNGLREVGENDDAFPALVSALVDCVALHGPLPEREEWPGLVEALTSQGDVHGVMRSLSAADLACLLQAGNTLS